MLKGAVCIFSSCFQKWNDNFYFKRMFPLIHNISMPLFLLMSSVLFLISGLEIGSIHTQLFRYNIFYLFQYFLFTLSLVSSPVRTDGKWGADLKLEADSAWDLWETGAHEKAEGVHVLQRCAERPPGRGTHGGHDGGKSNVQSTVHVLLVCLHDFQGNYVTLDLFYVLSVWRGSL